MCLYVGQGADLETGVILLVRILKNFEKKRKWKKRPGSEKKKKLKHETRRLRTK